MTKAVECMGQVLSGGCVAVPVTVLQELQLKPRMRVRVILVPVEETPEEKEQRLAERAEAFRKLDELQETFSGIDLDLTESLVQAREEEDAAS